MFISSATIDCWLFTTGHGAGGVQNDAYSDYQHHHWDIMASNSIDRTLSNKPPYTWTCDGNGQDDNGSWSTSKSITSNAQVFINSANVIILAQTVGFGVNQVTATGSTAHTTHWIPELTWPALTWSPSIN